MEELTVSQISREYKINHSTINKWLRAKKIPARKKFGELGIEYYLVRRGDFENYLQNRPKRGRTLNR